MGQSMNKVTKNEVAKFLEELLFFCVPWEVRSVSHQVRCNGT